MYALLDTCIFLDILFERKPYFESSKLTIERLKQNDSKIFVAPTSLKDIYYFLRKKLNDSNTAIDVIHRIYSITNKILDITADDTITAIFDSGDFEDNIIIECAKRNMLDCIITRNIKDFKFKGIAVLTPEEFLIATKESS